jgi:hypothetical protein
MPCARTHRREQPALSSFTDRKRNKSMPPMKTLDNTIAELEAMRRSCLDKANEIAGFIETLKKFNGPENNPPPTAGPKPKRKYVRKEKAETVQRPAPPGEKSVSFSDAIKMAISFLANPTGNEILAEARKQNPAAMAGKDKANVMTGLYYWWTQGKIEKNGTGATATWKILDAEFFKT